MGIDMRNRTVRISDKDSALGVVFLIALVAAALLGSIGISFLNGLTTVLLGVILVRETRYII